MKYFFILFAGILFSSSAFCQKDSSEKQAPYLQYPTIPAFTLYTAPDSSAFTREDLKKNKNTIFIVFSPDCSHCQNEAKMITENIKKFRNTQFVMLTYLPYEEMMAFYKVFRIYKYPEITMGRDTKFFFPIYFGVRNLPGIYIYDRNGRFKKSFEGDVKPETILAEL